jgi:integrase
LRAQRTITYRTKHELEAELRRIGHAVDKGTYVKPWDGLVPELIDSYLRNGADQWEANTQLSYANALQPAREWFAHCNARSVVREDVEDYKRHLLTSGRKRGGTPGTALSPRSVNLAIGQLQAAFDLAERDGKVARNPVRFVKRVKQAKSARSTWSEAQVRQFIAAAAGDRLYACWLLSLLGLRRAEVLGLMWSDVSFTEGTVTIARSRVLVNAKVIEKAPKSRRSTRVLPLFPPLTTSPGEDADLGALEALFAFQGCEKAAAGAAYPAEMNDNYIAVDELGAPLHPERLSDGFARLCREAAVPLIRLHDPRASVNSLLEKLGVSDNLRAAWLGHTIAINRSAYLGAPRPEDLAVISAALGKIFRAA